MKTNNIVLLIISGLVLILSGCAYNAGYNPTYIPDENPEYFSSDNVLLFMEDEEKQFVFTGSPTSLTGSGTTLTLPLGYILKEVSEEVIEDRFSGVMGFSDKIDDNSKYELIFHPSLKRFEFRFNQLRNLGFAITPEVNFDLKIEFFDEEGNSIFSQLYQTGYVAGDTYLISGSPAEEVSQILHKTLYKILKQSFTDANSALVSRANTP